MSDANEILDRLEVIIPRLEEVQLLAKQAKFDMEEPGLTEALEMLRRALGKARGEALAETLQDGLNQPMAVSKPLSFPK